MKKISILCFAMMAGVSSIIAQPGGGGGFQQRTVEERVATAHQKIDSAFKLDATKLTEVDAAFKKYYTDQDKIMQAMRNNSGGERPDFATIRAQQEELKNTLDKSLKKILSKDEFKTYTDKIEPELNPRRGRGQGGPGGGGGNRQRN